MKTFAVPEDLANAILQYLIRQPYGDVAVLVTGLMQLKEIGTGEPALKIVPKEQP